MSACALEQDKRITAMYFHAQYKDLPSHEHTYRHQKSQISITLQNLTPTYYFHITSSNCDIVM
jgi:hypothetical protein